MVMARNNGTLNYGKQKAMARMDAQKRKHIVTVRMLIIILTDLIGIGFLLAMKKNFELETAFALDWLLPVTVVFGVLTAAAAVYQAVVFAKKIKTETHYVTPAMLLCVTAFCLVACLLYKRLLPMTIVIASVVGTALFIVYCLYVHIFYR